MRFTRHAKNRIRLIARSAPSVTEDAVLHALAAAETAPAERRTIEIGGTRLTIVVDEARQVVVTIWREG